MTMPLAMLNQAYPLLDGVAGEAAESDIVALPARCTTISWQTVFGTDPSAVSILLLASLDGENFVEVDDITTTTGGIATVVGNFTHVMAEIESITDGADVTVLMVPKDE